jgi:hypothetical protein
MERKMKRKFLSSHEVNIHNISKRSTKTLRKFWNDYEMTSDTAGLIVRELSRRLKAEEQKALRSELESLEAAAETEDSHENRVTTYTRIDKIQARLREIDEK